MKRPLLVNVAELLRRPGSERHMDVVVPAIDIGLRDPRVPSDADVRVVASLESAGGGIVVTGRVETDWYGQCRRCLSPTKGRQVSEIAELYQETVTAPDAFPVVGDQVDLEQMTREALVIDLPSAPLCRDDCAGICASCGADLNLSPCGCPAETADPRWAALDVLREQHD